MKKAFQEQLPGGQAAGMKPSDFDQVQLARGIEVEMEHTSDHDLATEIAMDHLKEDPDYYIKLEKIDPHHKKGASAMKLISYKGKIYTSAGSEEGSQELPILDASLLKDMREALKVILKADQAIEQACMKVDALLYGSRWPNIQNNSAARSAHAQVRGQSEKLTSIRGTFSDVHHQLKRISDALYSAYLHRTNSKP